MIFKIGDHSIFYSPSIIPQFSVADFTLILKDKVTMGSFGSHDSTSGGFRFTFNGH